MSSILGTNVGAPIVPVDSDDTYPSHLAQYGKGGYRSVASISARNAIPDDRREEGMVVYVEADETEYQLVNGIADTDWVVHSTGALTDLSDVSLTGPTANQYLKYDGTGWVNSTLALNEITSVSVSSPASGQVLRYDGSNWTNSVLSLSNIDKVSVGTLAAGNFLRYNGTNFVNVMPALSDISDVVTGSETNKYPLVYDSVLSKYNNERLPHDSLTKTGVAYITVAFTNTMSLANGVWAEVDVWDGSGTDDSGIASADPVTDHDVKGNVGSTHDGYYMINMHMSFSLDAATELDVLINSESTSSPTGLMATTTTVTNARDFISLSHPAPHPFQRSWKLWVKQSSGASATLTIRKASLSIHRISSDPITP